MVLAAGLGTRLQGVVPDKPKVLVEVGGEPLLARHLRLLEEAGVSCVVLNAHWLAAQIERFAADYTGALELQVVRENQPLGTAGGVRNALPLLGAGPILVLYGDVMLDAPVREMLNSHAASTAVATLGVYESSETEGKGTVEVDNDDRITAFREKAGEGVASRLINAGLYVVDAAFVRSLNGPDPLDFGNDVFPSALEHGEHLQAHRIDGPVIDIGTPEGLDFARATVRARG